MRRLVHILSGIALTMAGSASAVPVAPRQPAAASVAPGAPLDRASLQAFVDGAVADAMRADHIAGVAVAIADASGPVLVKGYGAADVAKGVPVDPARTLFRIGSLSKTFTWILLMREVEKGRVKLDAPVNDYLPDALKLPQDGKGKTVRVVDLMDHSAGFEDSGLGHMLVGDGAKVVPLADYLAKHRPDLVREANSAPAYSNYGAALAGAIVAHLNKTDFASLVERDLTGPLGIAGDMTFREPYPARAGLPAPMPADILARVATGYTWTGAGYQPHGFEYIGNVAPAGSGSATAQAIARYMQAQLAGGAPLYGPRAAAAFRTPIPGATAGRNWAHGFMITPLAPGVTGYGHAGATGFFLSNMVLIPELGIGVFVATNTDTGRPLATRLPEMIAQRLAGAAPMQRAGDPALLKDAAAYSGVYLSTRRAYSGLEKFVTLLGAAGSVRVTPDGYLVTQAGPVTQAWVKGDAPDQFVSATGEQSFTFQRDASGRVSGYVAANGMSAMERASAIYNPQLLIMLAVLALIAAIGVVTGAILHRKQPASAHRVQKLSGRGIAIVAGLWILAFIGFALWGASAGVREVLVYGFPGLFLPLASYAALFATIGAGALLIALPFALRAPREDGWKRWRKVRHSLAVLLFLALGLTIGAWGGLQPWA